MTHSRPAPVPPGARRGPMIRCARCQSPLYHTKLSGRPRQEDHEQGCEAFSMAMRITRFVDELKRSASEPAGSWRKTRRRRKYMRDGAKMLAVTACEPDPAAAVSALGELYQAECQTRGKRARAAERTERTERTERAERAETLMRACRRLAAGQDPAPVTPRSA